MRRFAVLLASALLGGCSTSPGTSETTVRSSPTSQPSAEAARVVPGGCGSTQLLSGGIPPWLDEAGAHNNPTGLIYVVATPVHAGGFLFGYPLTAGPRPNSSNKILWVVGTPRNGSSLEISGHPLGALTPMVHMTQAADSFPGEIYPTIVDVPKPGCWHFDLAWASNRTSVDLLYG